MRLADAIALFNRRAFDRMDLLVQEVWVDVDYKRARYTLVFDTEVDTYNQALVAQKYRRMFSEDKVEILYRTKQSFVKRYTSYKIFPV